MLKVDCYLIVSLGRGECYVEVWWLWVCGGDSWDSVSGGVWVWLWCDLLLDFDFVLVRVSSWVLWGIDALWDLIVNESLVDAFMLVSGGWIGLTLHFLSLIVSLWNDDGSRIVELVLVVSKLSIMITVILINSPGVIFGVA